MSGFKVDFEPLGKRVSVNDHESLLVGAQKAGISVSAICGGLGICHDCKIRCMSGKLSDIRPVEREAFSDDELLNGWRLACQAFPRSDLKIEIPPDSMTTTQRLQVEGVTRVVASKPYVHAVPVSLTPPDLTDLRADWDRFLAQLSTGMAGNREPALPVIRQFSEGMRKWGWTGQAVLSTDGDVIGFLPVGEANFGLAIDIGTTKMAVFLVDLATGAPLVKKGIMNPQIAYGEDVLSRIAYANQSESQRKALQTRLVDALNNLILSFCDNFGIHQRQIVDFVVVGNTAMHHLFAGLPVQQLGMAPYVPVVSKPLRFPAREIGLVSAPGAMVYMPPNIAGYVGADHIAMLLAADLFQYEGVSLAVDIGTNTEISLLKNGNLVCCSCASGPAFEGAHIFEGMRASPGAIERAQFFEGDWHFVTIDNKPPVGICGSGILDVVSEMLRNGHIDQTGRFTHRVIRRVGDGKDESFILVAASKSGTGKDILVTRSDIREIQLAKAAIRAGIEALLRGTSTEEGEIRHIIIAGAFGTYLNIESAIRVGMFPDLPHETFLQIGNAAGVGAYEMLISEASKRNAEALFHRMSYIELTTDKGFIDSYVEAMGYEKKFMEV